MKTKSSFLCLGIALLFGIIFQGCKPRRPSSTVKDVFEIDPVGEPVTHAFFFTPKSDHNNAFASESETGANSAFAENNLISDKTGFGYRLFPSVSGTKIKEQILPLIASSIPEGHTVILGVGSHGGEDGYGHPGGDTFSLTELLQIMQSERRKSGKGPLKRLILDINMCFSGLQRVDGSRFRDLYDSSLFFYPSDDTVSYGHVTRLDLTRLYNSKSTIGDYIDKYLEERKREISPDHISSNGKGWTKPFVDIFPKNKANQIRKERITRYLVSDFEALRFKKSGYRFFKSRDSNGLESVGAEFDANAVHRCIASTRFFEDRSRFILYGEGCELYLERAGHELRDFAFDDGEFDEKVVNVVFGGTSGILAMKVISDPDPVSARLGKISHLNKIHGIAIDPGWAEDKSPARLAKLDDLFSEKWVKLAEEYLILKIDLFLRTEFSRPHEGFLAIGGDVDFKGASEFLHKYGVNAWSESAKIAFHDEVYIGLPSNANQSETAGLLAKRIEKVSGGKILMRAHSPSGLFTNPSTYQDNVRSFVTSMLALDKLRIPWSKYTCSSQVAIVHIGGVGETQVSDWNGGKAWYGDIGKFTEEVLANLGCVASK